MKEALAWVQLQEGICHSDMGMWAWMCVGMECAQGCVCCVGVDVRGEGCAQGMCFGPKTLHHDSVSAQIQVDGSIPLGR